MWFQSLIFALIFPHEISSLKSYTEGDLSSIFASTFQMQTLLKAELEILPKLTGLAALLENQAKFINNFVDKKYKDFQVPQDLESYVSHPFNAFGVVSRTGYLKSELMIEAISSM